MSVFEIPVQPGTPQTFRITLNNAVYTFTLRWCAAAQAWALDIADGSGVPLAQGLLLVTASDLLEQLAYLRIGGKLVVQTDHAQFAVPTFSNLGGTAHLYFITP